MTSLQDIVLDWGLSQVPPLETYDEAKRALIAGRTNSEVLDAGAPATSWNEALYNLADIPSVLRTDSVLWLDARYSVEGEQSAVNRGTGGTALDAKYGSTTGADTNDPLLLTHAGENYVYLPGAASNTLSVPDAAALDITGDIEIVARLSATDWTPAAAGTITSRSTLVDPNRAWNVSLNTNGTLAFAWYPTGSSASGIFKNSTIAPTVSDGQTIWVKVTLDVDNGAAGNTVRFYTAADQATEPSSWTQLGSNVVTAGTTSLPNVTSPLYVGAHGPTSAPFTGNVYRTIVRNGIDGTTVLDIDCPTDITDAGATSFTATSGQTVTVNRATSGRKTALVTRPIWLFGTDDYLEVADNALLNFGASDSFTALVVVRIHNTSGAFPRFLAKTTNDADDGWSLSQPLSIGVTAVIDQGANRASRDGLSTWTVSTLATAGMITDRNAQTLVSFANNSLSATTSTAAVGDISSAVPLMIGRNNTPAQYCEMELVAVGVWRRVLTTNEIAQINTYYGTA